MIVKGHQRLEVEAARIAITRGEVRASLIELWSQIFEAELRADLAAERMTTPTDSATDGSTETQTTSAGWRPATIGGHE